MKKVLLGAVCVFALSAGAASAEATGHIGLSATHGEVEVSGFEGDGQIFNLSGAVSAPISERLSIQGAASYSDADDAEGAFSGTVHLVGELDTVRIAGFVGATEADNDELLFGGVEAQANLEQVTLAGAVTYGSVDDVDLWSIGAQARYFVSDNFRLDGGVTWLTVDAGVGDIDAWTIGLGGEYQFAGPVSVFGGYNRVEINDLDTEANLFTIGLRYNFGGTLKDRDRSGASFGGASNLSAVSLF